MIRCYFPPPRSGVRPGSAALTGPPPDESTHANAWIGESTRARRRTQPTKSPVITQTGLDILRYICSDLLGPLRWIFGAGAHQRGCEVSHHRLIGFNRGPSREIRRPQIPTSLPFSSSLNTSISILAPSRAHSSNTVACPSLLRIPSRTSAPA